MGYGGPPTGMSGGRRGGGVMETCLAWYVMMQSIQKHSRLTKYSIAPLVYVVAVLLKTVQNV